MSNRTISSIELFSGAGGLALGVARAGFHHRLLLEYNRTACMTLVRNRDLFGGSSCQIYEGDVRKYDFTSHKGLDLLAAGAPCQPFSIGGRHRADKDERNLFPEVFRVIRELRPRAVLIENVKGLLRPALREFVEYVTLQLEMPDVVAPEPLDPDGWVDHLPRLRGARRGTAGSVDSGYRVRHALLNAADYGVPQRRERVFFVALRKDVRGRWTPPPKTHSQAALRLDQEVTGEYWARHSIKRRSMASHPLAGKWRNEAGDTAPWVTLRDRLAGLPDPADKSFTPSIPNHVFQPGAKVYPGHTGSALDLPAKTLKAGVHGVPGGENMLRRPNGTVRYLTVREAARVQTFPDDFVFVGAWGEAMRQIGNAVPVVLAQAVARSIASALRTDGTSPTESARRLDDEYVQEDLVASLIGSP